MKAFLKRHGGTLADLTVIAAVCICVEIVFLRLTSADIFKYPLMYLPDPNASDGITTLVLIKNLASGHYLTNPLIGAPFGAAYFDAIGYYTQYLFLLFWRVCLLFTKNYVFIFNFQILLIPIACALVCYFVFRHLSLTRPLSVLGALSFGLCAYVEQKLGSHTCLAACQFIPLSFLLCYWLVADDRFMRFKKGFFKYRRNLLALFFCLLIANNGIAYYPFFTCFFLIVTALFGLIRDRRWHGVLGASALVAVIAALFMVNFTPMILAKLRGLSVVDGNVNRRFFFEAQTYALRLSSLFLPQDGFGIEALRAGITKYNFAANENAIGYLGFVGIAGFMMLVAHSVSKKKEGDPSEPALSLLSGLTVSALLLAVIDGFGCMLAVLVPQIRCYNRISPFIDFFCVLAFCLTVQKIAPKIKRETLRRLFIAGVALFMCAGLIEQIQMKPDNRAEIAAQWDSDADFADQIERTSGADAMVFQLPYLGYPESATTGLMMDYEPFVLFLHSDTLKSSYGALKTSESDRWYARVAELSAGDMVSELRSAGFAGIYVNKTAYTDYKWTLLEKELSGATGQTPIVSEDGDLYYFSLQ